MKVVAWLFSPLEFDASKLGNAYHFSRHDIPAWFQFNNTLHKQVQTNSSVM